MATHNDISDRLIGGLLGGAIGDALGAPLENNCNFSDLFKRYGHAGLQHMICYSADDSASHGIGAMTDDTSMLATTLEAINQTIAAHGNSDNFLYDSWQGYLHWGSCQQDGESLMAFHDHNLSWSDEIKPFWFTSGAGRGTMAALQTGKMGTLEDRLTYDTIIRGKVVKGPNNGCGSMMRIAPLGFLSVGPGNIFNYAARNAAITHGATDAILATASIAMMVHLLINNKSATNTVLAVHDYLHKHYPVAGASCIAALEAGMNVSAVHSTNIINAIPAGLGFKNPFLAIPVLAQVVYCLMASDLIQGDAQTVFHTILPIAVTHAGDSDSVGAIVGNCLGAKFGRAALPPEWLHDLQCKDHLMALAQPFINSDRIIRPVI